MKKKSLLLIMLLSLAMFLVACGGNTANDSAAANEAAANGNAAAEEGAAPASDLVIGFVTDEGGINDASFNQGIYEGLGLAEQDLGITRVYKESADSKDYAPNFEAILDENADLIIGAGFKMGADIEKVAKQNPDVKYAIVDHAPEEAIPNLLGITFRDQEPSFLVGYIAGLTTETGKVGFVGGQEGPLIGSFEWGYKAGVRYAAQELGTDIEVLTQYVGGFTDAQKGKAIAAQMYQQGADVVFHAAGGAGDGVIEAAKEADKWVIGVDRDQNEAAPDNVLTSAMKNANVAVYQVVQKLVEEDAFDGGQNIELGLSDEGAVGIAPTSDKNVKPEVLEKVKAVEEKIISGEIVVPESEETFNAQ
ncbi:BMP family ABC transporter substrate-binding protein [Peptoniphilus equinus]|uniref:BMP family ABC transporter substrate-binding protein n=1 Tax=Peptoniphilus equinus TaxID=3016343 RepID=A0ABY7QSG8_9FIRM|nr:BMP family ABC transporter substrate-binding protein [Peptoniphilus equinus]WBW49719.1 BMP family ABC transporter substrate-binding protein [Peptoniphilus equinus]